MTLWLWYLVTTEEETKLFSMGETIQTSLVPKIDDVCRAES
jgi:hypothetical protein